MKDYSKMLVAELRTVAKDAGIRGYSKMRKAELVNALTAKNNSEAAAQAIGTAKPVAPRPSTGGFVLADGVTPATCREVNAEIMATKAEIHTAGELHTPPCTPRVTFAYNLSDLLDDPARKPDAELVKLDGTDPRMQDFVFGTDGALGLYRDMLTSIKRQLARGKSVVVMVLCRGGKHRSVAFGEALAEHFGVTATHHHRHLPIVKHAKGPQ